MSDTPIESVQQRPFPASAVSCVIVNYNSGGFLCRCVESVLRSSLPVEVIVVDNASDDLSVSLMMDRCLDGPVRVIRNRDNLGFARAANMGMARAQSEWILLLNPDCVVETDTIERVLRELQMRPEVGMAGPLLKNPDGTEQAGCRRMIPTPGRAIIRTLHLERWSRHWQMAGGLLHGTPLPAGPVEVEAISGAFMLVRRCAMEVVGPMDEGYFLHAEDIDWCVRFREHGWKILFVPDASAWHEKGVCSRRHPLRVEWYKHQGMMRLYRKLSGGGWSVCCLWLMDAAILLRFAAVVVIRALHGVRR